MLKNNPWIKIGCGLAIGVQLGIQLMAMAKAVAERLATKLLEEANVNKQENGI